MSRTQHDLFARFANLEHGQFPNPHTPIEASGDDHIDIVIYIYIHDLRSNHMGAQNSWPPPPCLLWPHNECHGVCSKTRWQTISCYIMLAPGPSTSSRMTESGSTFFYVAMTAKVNSQRASLRPSTKHNCFICEAGHGYIPGNMMALADIRRNNWHSYGTCDLGDMPTP